MSDKPAPSLENPLSFPAISAAAATTTIRAGGARPVAGLSQNGAGAGRAHQQAGAGLAQKQAAGADRIAGARPVASLAQNGVGPDGSAASRPHKQAPPFPPPPLPNLQNGFQKRQAAATKTTAAIKIKVKFPKPSSVFNGKAPSLSAKPPVSFVAGPRPSPAPSSSPLPKKNLLPSHPPSKNPLLENSPSPQPPPPGPPAANDSADGPKIMRVRKRDNSLEPVNVNKIINVVIACSSGLKEVDPMRVAAKVISGLYDGATTKELDRLCIQTASLLIGEEPDYSRLSARLLSRYIDEEVMSQNINNFFASVKAGYKKGILHRDTYEFVREHKEPLNITADKSLTKKLEYFGLRTIYDRYLLKDPESRQALETPQYFFLRTACGAAKSFTEAKEFYDLLSGLDYMPSSPTLFNSGGPRPQMSSCYLLDSPKDDLSAIYDKYKDVALLSKFAGGIGLSFSRVRSRGSLIRGTNGKSNGVIPFLKTLDSSVAAVNQGGRRKGAACIYLETWHADIESFLELRDNTGDERRRAHHLNIANWVPDLFMERAERDEQWSLFDPKETPELVDSFGEEFNRLYKEAEARGAAVKTLPARSLFSRMMKTLAETGNGWMNFKDQSNRKSNQTLRPENQIHLSNLCTEILEVTSDKETAVCNLGSVNIGAFYDSRSRGIQWDRLASVTQTAVRFLNRVIDINYYPVSTSKKSNRVWRPIGLGLMGLQDLFFKMEIPFESDEALEMTAKIQEEIYYQALFASMKLAEKSGPHENFKDTRAAEGILQFDLWNVTPSDTKRWYNLKAQIKKHGLRNSLIAAIAPTATIASIVGVYEAIEPQLSNLFKRETLSGEFIQINKYLTRKLKREGLWNQAIREKIKSANGSVQGIAEIPQRIKDVFKTVWEIPQKALIDRAVARGPFIDQSQSLNLFMESPTINKLSSMYMYAWKKGLKTTYYLRSRPATNIAKVTVGLNGASFDKEPAGAVAVKAEEEGAQKQALDLENPELCESCQ